MSERTSGSGPASSLPLPDAPNLQWLRKQAKRRLAELRKTTPGAKPLPWRRVPHDIVKRSSRQALRSVLDVRISQPKMLFAQPVPKIG
jgi:hypothetical protein